MIQVEGKPCWVIHCDVCGEGDNSEYSCAFHHCSKQEAIDSARDTDWFVSDAGIVLCKACIEEYVVENASCPTCGAVPKGSCPGHPLGHDARIALYAETVRPSETRAV